MHIARRCSHLRCPKCDPKGVSVCSKPIYTHLHLFGKVCILVVHTHTHLPKLREVCHWRHIGLTNRFHGYKGRISALLPGTKWRHNHPAKLTPWQLYPPSNTHTKRCVCMSAYLLHTPTPLYKNLKVCVCTTRTHTACQRGVRMCRWVCYTDLHLFKEVLVCVSNHFTPPPPLCKGGCVCVSHLGDRTVPRIYIYGSDTNVTLCWWHISLLKNSLRSLNCHTFWDLAACPCQRFLHFGKTLIIGCSCPQYGKLMGLNMTADRGMHWNYLGLQLFPSGWYTGKDRTQKCGSERVTV